MTNFTMNHMIENAPPLGLVAAAIFYFMISNRVLGYLVTSWRAERAEKAAHAERRAARIAERAQIIALPAARRPSPRPRKDVA